MWLVLSPSYGVGSRRKKGEEDLDTDFKRELEDGARKRVTRYSSLFIFS
jgi:hypothetical protein